MSWMCGTKPRPRSAVWRQVLRRSHAATGAVNALPAVRPIAWAATTGAIDRVTRPATCPLADKAAPEEQLAGRAATQIDFVATIWAQGMYRHIQGGHTSGPRRDASESGHSFGSVKSGCQVRGAERPAAGSRRMNAGSRSCLAQSRAGFSDCQHLLDSGRAIAQRIEGRCDDHVQFSVCVHWSTPSGGFTVQGSVAVLSVRTLSASSLFKSDYALLSDALFARLDTSQGRRGVSHRPLGLPATAQWRLGGLATDRSRIRWSWTFSSVPSFACESKSDRGNAQH